jgi:anhydro-N-acetylmuramic acid kinase
VAIAHYIGLMSGTSLDGADAVLAAFDGSTCQVIAHASKVFPDTLRAELLALNQSGQDELQRSALAANSLARLYAEAIEAVLAQAELQSNQVTAIGCHGQTIRHRPDLGFTSQIGNAALLAELTGITVVADFRSRDVAAGGQGAPLVPAFHQGVFAHTNHRRAVVNIGGISNLTFLAPDQPVLGFDCGPGNLLMDGWIMRHQGLPYDGNGAWAAQGRIIPFLLGTLLRHPFFAAHPPKSTGRDDFHLEWLMQCLQPEHSPVDVQATLLELTAQSIHRDVMAYCPDVQEVYVCGGGAYNRQLMHRLECLLHPIPLRNTDALGIPPMLVEAAAFAWLARQTLAGQPGNLPGVTGARGARILGAIYPA